MRDPALGDVHLAHDLDTRDHRILDLLGHALHLVEDAVDPISDLHAVFVRLEVDVRRAHLERLEEHHIDQLDDRRLVGDVEQVLGITDECGEIVERLSFDRLDRLVDHVRLVTVGLVDLCGDRAARHEDRFDLHSQELGEVVHRVDVERGAGRDLHDVVGDLDPEEVVVSREFDRDPVAEDLGDLHRVETLAERITVGFGEDLKDLLLREVGLAQDDAVERLPRLGFDPEAVVQLLGRELLPELLEHEIVHGDPLLGFMAKAPGPLLALRGLGSKVRSALGSRRRTLIRLRWPTLRDDGAARGDVELPLTLGGLRPQRVALGRTVRNLGPDRAEARIPRHVELT